ncbi:MAG: hypothetical protein GY898_21645 [Proteobacteria bacterium]|nr:hypothetical protein [Pseudomonadota bacterium]
MDTLDLAADHEVEGDDVTAAVGEAAPRLQRTHGVERQDPHRLGLGRRLGRRARVDRRTADGEDADEDEEAGQAGHGVFS